jgi:hypothetical protein
VDPEEPGGRHRRRRTNAAARAAFTEARRAGLVQRHLMRLRHLVARSPGACPVPGEQVPLAVDGVAPDAAVVRPTSDAHPQAEPVWPSHTRSRSDDTPEAA